MTDELRVWLDDDPVDFSAPAGWTHAITAWEAIELLDTGTVVALPLDHDLGDDDRCGTGNGSSTGSRNSRTCTTASCGRATASRSTPPTPPDGGVWPPASGTRPDEPSASSRRARQAASRCSGSRSTRRDRGRCRRHLDQWRDHARPPAQTVPTATAGTGDGPLWRGPVSSRSRRTTSTSCLRLPRSSTSPTAQSGR
ncbi:cyclic-phosphate processing receiver domain-containing protein [Paraconexibacter sp. AEG42_29]|uniref:cyclic-phosphate processing receiver domain-containing protein n=1 Tax=Paraconexibacter sp. AEG42_29 TaxID=2997339 RepID=UPI00339D8604